MSASSQSYPASALPLKPLTITEVEIEPAPLLGPSKIYFYAAAGTAFGILFGAAIAACFWIPKWLPQSSVAADAAGPVPVSGAPQGPRDFESVKAIVAGLNGHLTTEWR